MKIFVTGTRGIPDIPGGVEKHCEQIYPRIVQKGHEVILATRSPYVKSETKQWHGVKLSRSYAPRRKNLEAIIHTLIALLKAIRYSPDVVHIHAIGPSILTPLARLIGFRVVVTSQGPDYDRQKWGKLVRFVLRLGEKIGGTYANEVIVVSSVIRDIIRKRCHREPHLIYNGVSMPKPDRNFDFLSQIGAQPGRYILAVARFVPEKGLHDLVDAFKALDTDHKLVIAGDSDYECDYSRNLRRQARTDDRIILPGYITGGPLNQVYTHASLFVLPSYHEGLPLALLEAMSYGLPTLVSDIPANREVALPAERYFRAGNVGELKSKIETLLAKGLSKSEHERTRRQLKKEFNWDRIAEQTVDVYCQAIGGMKT